MEPAQLASPAQPRAIRGDRGRARLPRPQLRRFRALLIRSAYAPRLRTLRTGDVGIWPRQSSPTDGPSAARATCDAGCWRYSVEMLEHLPPAGEPPAVVVKEFMLGGGGVIPGSRASAQEIRNWCDEQGALLIADEALTGIGRTGSWFAFEHFGVRPDIVVTSKALGGGVPAAAVEIASRRVADAAIERGFIQAASHQGDPFQCAAALANIAVIESEDLLRNTVRQGRLLSSHLSRLVKQHAIAGDARGIGLIQGLEIVQPDGSEAPEVAS